MRSRTPGGWPTGTGLVAQGLCVRMGCRRGTSALGRGSMRKAAWMGLAAGLAAVLVGGCQGGGRLPRTIGPQALGSLGPQGVREVYHTPAFVVRAAHGGRHTAVQDTDLAADEVVDDSNLLIFAEGAGDTVDAFRWTAALLAEAPHGFPEDPDRLVMVLLRWSESTSIAREHLNRAAHEKAAQLLRHMAEVHRRRHGDRGRLALVGFSAGSHVIRLAFSGPRDPREEAGPEGLRHVSNVVFLGSSIGGDEPLALDGIRGRFLNFINPRDTHFGDRLVYAAPAGDRPRPLEFLKQGTVLRRPGYGASAAGFRYLPTLTSPGQFDAIEEVRDPRASEAIHRAFRMVNVRVPEDLVPYDLFGQPVSSDDLDDVLNLGRNHFILVGRGPGGRTDGVEFAQYRRPAEEFVQEQVASAALAGRLDRTGLESRPAVANPLRVPLPVPWAVIRPPKEPEPAPPPEAPAPAAAPEPAP